MFDQEAFTAFVRDEPTGIDQTRFYSHAEAALSTLFEEGMSAAELLQRTGHGLFGDRLLNRIAEMFREAGRWSEFVKALLDMAADFIRKEFYDRKEVLALIDEIPLYPRHPFFQSLGGDAYWTRKIRWHIAKGDFRRAWDEFKKARKGGDLMPSYRTFDLLARELYRAMVAQGLINQIEGEPLMPQTVLLLGTHSLPSGWNDEGIIPAMQSYFRQKKNEARRAKVERQITGRVLPKSKIVVRSGVVVQVQEWTDWNGEFCITIEIRREPTGFSCYMSDPSHGGSTARGTLDEALKGFHKTVAAQYRTLFTLEGATRESVRKAGFRGYEVEVVPTSAA